MHILHFVSICMIGLLLRFIRMSSLTRYITLVKRLRSNHQLIVNLLGFSMWSHVTYQTRNNIWDSDNQRDRGENIYRVRDPILGHCVTKKTSANQNFRHLVCIQKPMKFDSKEYLWVLFVGTQSLRHNRLVISSFWIRSSIFVLFLKNILIMFQLNHTILVPTLANASISDSRFTRHLFTNSHQTFHI